MRPRGSLTTWRQYLQLSCFRAVQRGLDQMDGVIRVNKAHQ